MEYTYEDIVTDTSVLNEAPNFFEEGKTICTGHIDDQPQAVIDYLFGGGLDEHPCTVEMRDWGKYYCWDKIEGVLDMEYIIPEKSDYNKFYICRSKVHIKIKVEYDIFADGTYFKVYRLDENDNVI